MAAVPSLQTPRLRLRPFTLADAAGHARIYAKPEVTRFLAGGPFLGEEAGRRSRAALELFVTHWARHGFGVWAVIDLATDALIGQCGLKYIPETPDVEILYALDTPYWGRGLTTEAASATLRHGFEATDLERIIALTRPEHRASRRVMEKLGMVYERDAVFFGIQAVVYAISRESFARRATSAPSAGGNA